MKPEHELLLTHMEEILARLADEGVGGAGLGPPRPEALARALLSEAARRAQFFSRLQFHDPQWLMLLDLFVARQREQEICVSSLCIASGVPPTTALRHMTFLERQGMIVKTPHPRDSRRSIVRLSDDAHRRMLDYLALVEGQFSRALQPVPALASKD